MADRLGSDGGGKTPNPFHHHHRRHNHHHHFFYVSPHCPLHRPILQPKNHAPSCQFSTFHSNPGPVASTQPEPDSGFGGAPISEELDDASMVIQDEAEIVEVDEEEEEPIFVLTDEWREFFAKSEAKRKLAKKQAKKSKN